MKVLMEIEVSSGKYCCSWGTAKTSEDCPQLLRDWSCKLEFKSSAGILIVDEDFGVLKPKKCLELIKYDSIFVVCTEIP